MLLSLSMVGENLGIIELNTKLKCLLKQNTSILYLLSRCIILTFFMVINFSRLEDFVGDFPLHSVLVQDLIAVWCPKHNYPGT